MDKKPKNHLDTFEEYCALQNLDPIAVLPIVNEHQPEWLQNYTLADTQLTIIAEGIREGRKPKPGEWMYVPVFFKDAANNGAGFGFSGASYDYWSTDTSVGERHAFFTREDAEFFGRQFLPLHKITKLI